MRKTINKSNMLKFIAFMSAKYGVKVLDKRSGPSWRIRRVVNALGIRRVKEWLNKWSITVPGVVWLSFAVGEGNENELKRQIMTIGHEFIHIQQWRKCRVRFLFRYCFSKSRRAHYETHARHANLEIGHQLAYPYVSTRRLAQELSAYRCRRADVQVAKIHLESYNRSVVRGAVAEPVSKTILNWWKI